MNKNFIKIIALVIYTAILHYACGSSKRIENNTSSSDNVLNTTPPRSEVDVTPAQSTQMEPQVQKIDVNAVQAKPEFVPSLQENRTPLPVTEEPLDSDVNTIKENSKKKKKG